MPMSVEEILAALAGIIEAAKDEDGEERPLTDEEAERYEALEGQLQAVQRSEEIQKRQKAYTMLAPRVHVATAPKDDTLDRAFDHYVRTGKENQDIVELRAQSVGVDAAGGFIVPETFRDKLEERMKLFGGVANEAEVIQTSSGEPIRWPAINDTANKGTVVAEGAAPTGGTDLVFTEIVLNAFRYVAPGVDNTGADPLRVSVELVNDSMFDIQGLVTRKLGERIARKVAEHYVSGTGTGQPQGIGTGTTIQTTFTAVSPTFAELLSAVHDVDPAYRMNAVWMFNDGTLEKIRGIVDTQGRPLWLPQAESGMTDNPGGMLLGHRVAIDQDFLTHTDGVAQTFGVFGSVREGYITRRVRDLALIVDPFTRAAFGQVAYTLWGRFDGRIQQGGAFTVLRNAV